MPDLDTGLTCVTEERRREGEEETLLSCGQSVLQVCHSTDLSTFSSSVGEECQEVFRRTCRLLLTRRPTDQRVKTCYTPLSRSCITRYSTVSREEGSHEDSAGLRLTLARPSHSAGTSQPGAPRLQTSCVIIRSVSGINQTIITLSSDTDQGHGGSCRDLSSHSHHRLQEHQQGPPRHQTCPQLQRLQHTDLLLRSLLRECRKAPSDKVVL